MAVLLANCLADRSSADCLRTWSESPPLSNPAVDRVRPRGLRWRPWSRPFPRPCGWKSRRPRARNLLAGVVRHLRVRRSFR